MKLKNIITLLILSLLVSCSSKDEKLINLFDLETEEAVVVKYYPDSTPQIVNYYKRNQPKENRAIIGQVSYYENNNEFMGGRMENGKRVGAWKAFFKNGTVQTEAFYVNGKPDGDYKIYHDNGQLLYLQHYTHGVCSGKWLFFDTIGEVTREVNVTESMLMCDGCSKCRALRSKQ